MGLGLNWAKPRQESSITSDYGEDHHTPPVWAEFNAEGEAIKGSTHIPTLSESTALWQREVCSITSSFQGSWVNVYTREPLSLTHARQHHSSSTIRPTEKVSWKHPLNLNTRRCKPINLSHQPVELSTRRRSRVQSDILSIVWESERNLSCL